MSLSVCQPPLQALCRVWIILMEGCAKPNPWSWCWESARVSTLCVCASMFVKLRVCEWKRQLSDCDDAKATITTIVIIHVMQYYHLLSGVIKWSDNLDHLFILLKRDCRHELSQILNSNCWQLKAVSIILHAIIQTAVAVNNLFFFLY